MASLGFSVHCYESILTKILQIFPSLQVLLLPVQYNLFTLSRSHGDVNAVISYQPLIPYNFLSAFCNFTKRPFTFTCESENTKIYLSCLFLQL